MKWFRKIGEPLGAFGSATALIAGPASGWGRTEWLAQAMLSSALAIIGIAIAFLVIANVLEQRRGPC
jgi:hypothetical protein